jgi:uncharacterized membrane protein
VAHITKSIEIGCPPQTVFDVLSRVDRLREFSEMTVEVRDHPGRPVVAGDTFVQVIKVAGVDLTSEWEVVEVSPPNLLRFRGRSAANGSAELTERIEQTADGSLVALTVDYELPLGLLGKVADKLVLERQSEQSAEDILERLRALCTGGS